MTKRFDIDGVSGLLQLGKGGLVISDNGGTFEIDGNPITLQMAYDNGAPIIIDSTSGEVIYSATGAGMSDTDRLISFKDTGDSETAFVNADGTAKFSSIEITDTPTADTDAATKAYVDNAIAGLQPKAACNAATTTNETDITLSGTQTIDGVALVAGDRVLVKNQDTNPEENGIWVVDSGVWSRAEDADGNPQGEVSQGMYTVVIDGTANDSTAWILTTPNPIVVGTTPLTFVQFAKITSPVESVNGQTGTVVLETDDISDTGQTNKWTTQADIDKLAGIEAGATADMTDAEIKIAYENNADTNAFTDADEAKLDGIEALADVTDSDNVSAAGATMYVDTDVSAAGWVVDEDNMASDSDQLVPTQQSVKAYVDAAASGSVQQIFITNATNINGGEVVNPTITNGEVTSIFSDTNDIRVEVTALGGSTGFIPTATVDAVGLGASVPVSNFTLTNGYWVGTADLIGATDGLIQATHQDGDVATTTLTVGAGPVIQKIEFDGVGNVYENAASGSSRLAGGVSVTVHIETDVEVETIELNDGQSSNDNAVADGTFNVSGQNGGNFNGGGYDYTITATTQNHNTVNTTARSISARATDDNNFTGDYANSTDFGSTDEVHTVICDNVAPSASISISGYPASQQAIKSGESATVNFSTNIGNSGISGTATWSTPLSQVTLDDLDGTEATRTATYASGGYNISSANVQVDVTRTENGRTGSDTDIVFIANTTPELTISVPAARLRSAPTGENHLIQVDCSQRLIDGGFDLTASSGTWQGASWSYNNNGTQGRLTRNLEIDENPANSPQGAATFSAASGVTNLAGIPVNTIASGDENYVVGGFVARAVTFSISSPPRWIADIGTTVVDDSKVVVITNDNSPNYPTETTLTYTDGPSLDLNGFASTQEALTNDGTSGGWGSFPSAPSTSVQYGYTIVDSNVPETLDFDATGRYFFNLDWNIGVGNFTAGTYELVIEETV